MDLPAQVIVFCPTLEIKNRPATLMSVSPQGYFELLMDFNGRRHRVLAPAAQTGLVFNDPEPDVGTLLEVER